MRQVCVLREKVDLLLDHLLVLLLRLAREGYSERLAPVGVDHTLEVRFPQLGDALVAGLLIRVVSAYPEPTQHDERQDADKDGMFGALLQEPDQTLLQLLEFPLLLLLPLLDVVA